jgi:hypothetical protein
MVVVVVSAGEDISSVVVKWKERPLLDIVLVL